MNKHHSLEYIKRQAKKLKKERNITHTQALEILAKENGYSNWKHFQRSLSEQPAPGVKPVEEELQISFTDWLKKHKNRDSPLGDLATDAIKDAKWPSYNTLDEYRDYLYSHSAVYGAVRTLEGAWKSYKAYLKRKKQSNLNRPKKKPIVKQHDSRKIVYINNVSPLHFTKRTVEKFNPSDPAWISWDGRKAIPVTIIEVDDIYYTFKVERPLKKAGDEYYLRLDEVRSTPELACINHVTL
jgi:hypothetical protein